MHDAVEAASFLKDNGDAINILVGVCAEAGIENDRLRWSWG